MIKILRFHLSGRQEQDGFCKKCGTVHLGQQLQRNIPGDENLFWKYFILQIYWGRDFIMQIFCKHHFLLSGDKYNLNFVTRKWRSDVVSLNALKIHRHWKDFHSSLKMHTFDVYDCTLNILGLVDSYGYFFCKFVWKYCVMFGKWSFIKAFS